MGVRQGTFEDYGGFVAKFKPKKTTDDCYTPAPVYEAVRGWAVDEYGLAGREVVRPFYPGGDYLSFDYPAGCVVIDNPPFSILSRIVRDYARMGVDYFLFAPHLTCLGICPDVPDVCRVVAYATIEYENGAKVNTSFVTNLDMAVARSAPVLRGRIMAAVESLRAERRAKPPVYAYPPELITASALGNLSKHGVDLRIPRGECRFTRALDAQRAQGKGIYGSGFLISERAAAERAAAERAAAERAAAERAAAVRYELSDRERSIVAALA